MMVFSFLRKKVIKNQIQTFFIVIILFHLILNSLAWSLSMTNQKFFTSQNQKRVSNYLLWVLDLRGPFTSAKRYIILFRLLFQQETLFLTIHTLLCQQSSILENLSKKLSPTHKYLLYIIYILPIVLYGFQL